MNRTQKPRRNTPRMARYVPPISKMDKLFEARATTKKKPQKLPKAEKPIKHYDTHDDPAKQLINEKFARNVVKFFGTGPTVVILDTAKGVTSKHLMNLGIRPYQITAPNINEADCQALRKLGVNSFESTIEDVVKTASFDVGWHDSMTIMGGGKDPYGYVGLFAHYFLRTNHRWRCILAITITTQSNQTDCNYLPQKKVLTRQIRALIAWHGMMVVAEDCQAYKHNQVFGMWNIIPSPQPVTKQKLLTRDNNRLIGFPLGFMEKNLNDKEA
jgi:hypothetical protein